MSIVVQEWGMRYQAHSKRHDLALYVNLEMSLHLKQVFNSRKTSSPGSNNKYQSFSSKIIN